MSEIPLFKVAMSDDVINNVSSTLKSGFVSQGKRVEEFENLLSAYVNNDYVLTLNSATSGLTLAVRLLLDDANLNNENDYEVLTPALTCFATTVPILANNLKIKWVDVDLNTCNLNLEDLRNKISAKTKIIIAMHWAGSVNDMDEIDKICEECYIKYGNRPMVIEDCAHAFGATYKGSILGSSNKNICVFSFQAIKHLTTCDGGLITLPNETLYNRCKLLRWFGIDRNARNYKGTDLRLEEDIKEWGYKFHMNDLNATIGIYNFNLFLKNLELHRENARYYNKMLCNLRKITLLSFNYDTESSYWIYSMKINYNDTYNKNNFIRYMKENNIFTSQVHNRNDTHTCVKEYSSILPNLDCLEKELVCIPVGWWLSLEDRQKIVDAILSWDNLS